VDRASHGRGWVSQKLLLRAVEDDADWALRQIAERRVSVGSADDEAKANLLDAKEARILDLASDGLMSKRRRGAAWPRSTRRGEGSRRGGTSCA
jgi:hypothetical protein